jgi:hypothetical protein
MAGTPDKPRLYPTLVLFYDMVTSFCCMLLYWLCSSERAASIEYMRAPGQGPIALMVLASGSSMAFEFNLSNNIFILVTSALTTSVCGNGIKICLIAYSAVLAGVNDALSWTGIAVVIVSVVAYAYLSFVDAQQPPPSKDEPKLVAAPTEATPLKKAEP